VGMSADADCLSAQSYFPLRAIRLAPLDPTRQYIFGWHPHGILVLSRIFCYGGVWEHLFPGLDFRVLGATPMFFVPFCRDICLVTHIRLPHLNPRSSVVCVCNITYPC
jgi:hypothetical protein